MASAAVAPARTEATSKTAANIFDICCSGFDWRFFWMGRDAETAVTTSAAKSKFAHRTKICKLRMI